MYRRNAVGKRTAGIRTPVGIGRAAERIFWNLKEVGQDRAGLLRQPARRAPVDELMQSTVIPLQRLGKMRNRQSLFAGVADR